MNQHPLKMFTLACLMLLSACQSVGAKKFVIYTFLPYQASEDIVPPRAKDVLRQQFNNRILGTQNINLVYNTADIPAIARRALANPQELVSLDMEDGRFDYAHTPKRLAAVVQQFKAVNPLSPVGFYSMVPMNTYAETTHISRYDQGNAAYAVLAEAVDYFAPSLYNYQGNNQQAWEIAAQYNIHASQTYRTGKKILPYLTPEVAENINDTSVKSTRWLSYQEMRFRLETLKRLGADGAIIWGSSQSRDAQGQPPKLSLQTPWVRAIMDFQQK